MDDELRQIRESKFNHVIFGLLLMGLVGSLLALTQEGISSPWFLRSAGLLLAALVAFGLRLTSRFVVATWVLVVELIGLVAGLLLEASHVAGFAPYLFTPVITIAGLLLGPLAALVSLAASVVAALLVMVVSEQFFPERLSLLLSPFGVALAVALLIIEATRHTTRLGDRLLESRHLLRRRTLEMLQALRELERLYQKGADLEQQLLNALAQEETLRQDGQLYRLISDALEEMNHNVRSYRQLLQRLSEKPGPQEQSELLEEAWRRLDALAALLVGLEEMALLDNNQVQLDYRAVDVTRLVAEVAGVARGLAREKPVEVRYQVAENLPLVPADPVRLRQALLQVLRNAVIFTDSGTIEVQAELSNGELLIFVSDTGIGMYQEEREAIFERFGKGGGTLARQRQGAGLGLSISQRLVELHGGRMWATSALGVGSTFYTALPLTRPHLPPPSRPVEASGVPTTAAGSLSRLHLLPPIEAGQQDESEAIPLGQEGGRLERVKPGLTRFGPVARFSSTYIMRFAVTVIGLLLLVAGLGATLALVNRPASSHPATPGQELPVQAVTASETPLRREPTATGLAFASPVLRPSPTITPTAPSPPTATSAALLPPVTLPRESPTPSAEVTQAVETATATPTPSPSPSPTPGVSLTFTPSVIETVVATPVTRPVPPLAERRLIFVAGRAGGQQLIRARLDGEAAPVEELPLEMVDYGGMSWSPDGRQLLYTGRQGDDLDLVLVGVACLDLSTPCEIDPLSLGGERGDDIQPAWSPDGRRIAFSSGRSGNFEIYVVETTCATRPAGCPDLPAALTSSHGYDEWPVWSPDGLQLAFVSDRDGNAEIYTVRLDGTGLQRITSHPAADWPVAWSPDGRWLLFPSNRDGHWNLYLAAANCPNLPGGCETSLTRLTGDSADERDPAWSPDGRSIAFASNRNGNWDIYTLPFLSNPPAEVPAGAWTQITVSPEDERYPVWEP